MEKYIFNRGAKIPKNKFYTKDISIEKLPAPKNLYFPMSMHIGKPAEVVVEIGDEVEIGTLLGKIDGMISANVHSSVSGKVVDIIEKDTLRGDASVVVIENDFKYKHIKLDAMASDFGIDEFVERIESAGITGKGGAGFPTHVKYNMEKHDAKYLLINGAECEPYSTTDHRVMVEYADKLIKAAKIISDIYSINETYFAVENHANEAKESLEKAITNAGVENFYVYTLDSIYPAGHADLQIEEVLGIEKKDHQRAGDIGVLQSNVSTLQAIYDAVVENKTFYKRIITVSGTQINNPKNLEVPMGTEIQYIIDHCGGLKEDAESIKMINGGPMMGKPFDDTSKPVNKETTSLLFLSKPTTEKESPCIRCARCVNQCPMNLQPILISNAYRNREYELGKELKSDACINCGICTYACPSKIDLLADIKALNEKLKEAADAN